MSETLDQPRLLVDAAPYLALPATRRIAARLDIEAARRAYLPDLDDPRRDWVSSVAAPAFAALARRLPERARRSFLTIGTGSGVDALAAIELLGAERVGLTDLFDDVVAVAAANVARNLAPGVAVEIVAAPGDLVSGLPADGRRFDVVYENLPNLPLDDDAAVAIGRTSGAHLARRSEAVPAAVVANHLVLHWLALVAARPRLVEDGVFLSTIGARVPLAVLFDMATTAGYRPSVLTFGWKLQADPDELFATHAAHQAKGHGPFHFYPQARLEAVFRDRDPERAGADALTIEAALAPDRLDAVAALAAHRRGEAIGHTVAVLASRPDAAS